MGRKMELDTAILTDMKAVGADSFKDNICMIEIDRIKPSMDNFYSMSEIEMLAEDIERQGLKHNLVVTEDADNLGYYFLKSGHRRFAAIEYLISEKRYTAKHIPCLVDGMKTHSENMLDLIMLNATTRVMTDAEIYKQYEVLREILEELKLEGKKVKGRLREKIAPFLNISPAQVGKIENIRHNATPEIQDAVENGELSITTADKIAKLPSEQQLKLAQEHTLSEIRTSDVPTKPKAASVKPKQSESVDKDPDEDEPEQYEPADDDPDENEPEQSKPADNDPDEGEPEPSVPEETQCEHYRAALLDCIRRATDTITSAATMKSIDRTVVQLQSELRNIMEEI